MIKYFCIAASNSYLGSCRIKWQWCRVFKTNVLQGVITIRIYINFFKKCTTSKSILICTNIIMSITSKTICWTTTTWSHVNHLAKFWASTPSLTCCYIIISRIRKISISLICTTYRNNIVISTLRSKTCGCYINPSLSFNLHYHVW